MQILKGLLLVLLSPVLMVLLVVALILFVVLWPFFSLHRHYRRTTHGYPWRWLKSRWGWGMKVEELARRLGMSAGELRAFSPKYTEVLIPKRSGGRRKLSVPDAKTKALQRFVLRRLLSRLRTDPSAIGFQPGKSIVDNALPHVGRRVVIHLDVVDFFPPRARIG